MPFFFRLDVFIHLTCELISLIRAFRAELHHEQMQKGAKQTVLAAHGFVKLA